jgi:hypothetical protein
MRRRSSRASNRHLKKNFNAAPLPEDKGWRLAVVQEATPFQLEVDPDVDPQRNLSRIGEGAGAKTSSERLKQSRGSPPAAIHDPYTGQAFPGVIPVPRRSAPGRTPG